MAKESVIYLKVDSKFYDDKIKRATDGIKAFEEDCKKAGKSLSEADNKTVEYTKALGNMGTVAKSAKGQMVELTKSFTELSLSYKKMTDEEKASPFGKAMAASIDQLKGRIVSLKTDLDDVSKSLGSAGGGTLDLNLGDGLKDAQGILKGITGALGDMSGSFSGASGIVSKFSGMLGNLGGGAGGAIKGLSAIGPAAMSMAGPLAAAALAVQQLVEAFKRNDDAMDMLKTKASPFMALWQNLQRLFDDIVQTFVNVEGKMMEMTGGFNHFTIALAPLSLALRGLRTTFALLKNGLEAVTEGLSLAVDWFKRLAGDTSVGQWAKQQINSFRGLVEDFSNMIEGIANTDTGKALHLDKLYSDLKSIWGSNSELTKTNKEIVALEDNIDKLRNANTRADADSRAKISDLRAKAAEADKYTEEERLAFLKQALQEEEAMGARQYELARKQYELAQKKGTITHNSDADEQAISDAYAAMKNAETELNERKRALNKPIASLTNKMDVTRIKDAKDETEALKAQYEERAAAEIAALDRQSMSERDYADAVYEIEKKALQNIVALYDEGTKERSEANTKLLTLEAKHKDDAAKAQINITKAQYNEEAAAQLAALDRQSMNETEYENAVYDIKKANLEKIVALYHEGTAEYAAANAAKEALERQHQDNLFKIDEKAKNKEKSKDSSTLSGLVGKAKSVGWNSNDLGIGDYKAKIEAGVDISDEEWNVALQKLNERLQSFGMDPVQIDFETGNLEQVFDEAKVQMEKFMSDMSSGVGSVSTIGNAFNDLKGIGEDLTEAFSGEMDAWDSLMTVFNSGISIMQTVIGVMEAINTLTELSSVLKDANAASAQKESMEVATGKSTEMMAEQAESQTAMMNTSMKMGEATAGAGSAMSGIPIVGPILAVAAIAAILGAIIPAVTKAKSAGKSGGFALGGIVPGNSMSGDNLSSRDYGINSGELILNKAQQGSIASQLTGNNPMQNLQLSTEISGTNLRIVMNNDNRSKGGSRGYYANIH